MAKFYSIFFYMSTSTPRRRKVRAESEVYCLSGEKLKKLSPTGEKALTHEYALLFDEKFGDTLHITYVDLISGEYEGRVYEYEVPPRCEKLIEVVKTREEEGSVLLVYKVAEDSVRKLESRRILGLGEVSAGLKIDSEILKSLIRH